MDSRACIQSESGGIGMGGFGGTSHTLFCYYYTTLHKGGFSSNWETWHTWNSWRWVMHVERLEEMCYIRSGLLFACHVGGSGGGRVHQLRVVVHVSSNS